MFSSFVKVYKKVVKFSFKHQKIFWVLVFSFMYLVSVDPMDRSIIIQVNWVRFEFETKSNLSTYYWFSVQLELTATDFLKWRLKKNNASFILNISMYFHLYVSTFSIGLQFTLQLCYAFLLCKWVINLIVIIVNPFFSRNIFSILNSWTTLLFQN